MIYLAIFLGKMIQVMFGNVRAIAVVKGLKKAAMALSIIEQTLWIIITATVVNGIIEYPLRAVAFVLGTSFGMWAGIKLEGKLALGVSKVEVVATKDQAKELTKDLRLQGYPVTTTRAIGLDGEKLTLDIKVKRKELKNLFEELKKHEDIFVTVFDIKTVQGGFIEKLEGN